MKRNFWRLSAVVALILSGLAGSTLHTPLAHASGYTVLIVYADGVQPTTLGNLILNESGVSAVDYFDARSATPTLAQLEAHTIVVTFSNSGFHDPVTLGNNLADYQDNGGIVVAFDFAWFNAGTLQLQGRWLTGGYSPYTSTSSLVFSSSSLGVYNTAQPLMSGITTLNAYYRMGVTLAPGATQVAAYTDGLPLVAYLGRAVGINAYVGDGPANFSSQFGTLVVNAARWLLTPVNCATTGPKFGTPVVDPTGTIATIPQTDANGYANDAYTTTNIASATNSATTGLTVGFMNVFVKANSGLRATIKIVASDADGCSATFDPTFTSSVRSAGAPVTDSYTGILASENTVAITNGTPGVSTMTITVNGHAFKLAGLKAGESQTVNIGSALSGDNNTVNVTSTGKPGGSAFLLIGPGQ